MPPDVFTKMFADKDKWIRARQLINIVMPSELDRIIEDCKQISAGIQEKTAFTAALIGADDAQATRGEPGGDGGFTAPGGFDRGRTGFGVLVDVSVKASHEFKALVFTKQLNHCCKCCIGCT